MLRNTLSLLSVSSLLHLASFVGSVEVANVTWISPSEGDSYTSGDTIVGRWNADKPVVSPSFRLCVHGAQPRSHEDDSDATDDTGTDGQDEGDGSCGEAVWPTIARSDSDESYMIHMSLPNTTSVAQCYIQMVDDFGAKMASPAFAFQPSTSEDDAEPAAADGTESSSDSDPDSPSPSSLSPASSPASASAPASSASPPPSIQPSNQPQTLPSLDESHIPVPTAAYAVPLSLVLSVLLAAAGLAYRQRRQLRAERTQEKAARATRHALSRHSTLSFAGFVALGNGAPAPAAAHSGAQSRSTSVNMMRAWRRDVSRYERHGHGRGRGSEHLETGAGAEAEGKVETRSDGYADDETYVARTDDGRSVVSHQPASSSSSSSSGQAKHAARPTRRMTREPFYAGGSTRTPPRRTLVPASVFRTAGVSPIGPPHARGERGGGDDGDDALSDVDLDLVTRRGKAKAEARGENENEKSRLEDIEDYASVTDEVMSRYCEFSPIPLSPAPPRREDFGVVRPERLHVRRYAEEPDSYELEKGLPPSPPVVHGDLYDLVAKKLSKGPPNV